MKKFLALAVVALVSFAAFCYEEPTKPSPEEVILQNGGHTKTNPLYVVTLATEEWATNTFLKKDEAIKGAFIEAQTTYSAVRSFNKYDSFKSIGVSYNTAQKRLIIQLTDVNDNNRTPTFPIWTYNGVTYNTEKTLNERTENSPLSMSFRITVANGSHSGESDEVSVDFDNDSDVVKQYETGLAKNIEDTPLTSATFVDSNGNKMKLEPFLLTLTDGTGRTFDYHFPEESGEFVTTVGGQPNTEFDEWLRGVFVEQNNATNLCYTVGNTTYRVLSLIGTGDNRGIVIGNPNTNLVFSGKQIIAASPVVFKSSVQFNSLVVDNSNVIANGNVTANQNFSVKKPSNIKFTDNNTDLQKLLEGENVNPIAKLYDDKKEVTWDVVMVGGEMKIFATSPYDETEYLKVNSVMTDKTTREDWNIRMDDGEMKFKTKN